jgi:hypothetical protein
MAGVSLLATITATYLSYFRPARIEMLVGRHIEMYPAPMQTVSGLVWGSVGFYLPITFHNWSARGGVVLEVELALIPPSGGVYNMSWMEFMMFHSSERRLVTKGIAQPIALGGKSSLREVVLFAWSQGEFPVESGEYRLVVSGYTRDSRKPQLVYKNRFLISADQVRDYKKALAEEMSLTMSLQIGSTSPKNELLTLESFPPLSG